MNYPALVSSSVERKVGKREGRGGIERFVGLERKGGKSEMGRDGRSHFQQSNLRVVSKIARASDRVGD